MVSPLTIDNKEVYSDCSDKIFDKRYNSPNLLRRYVHRAQYDSVISQLGEAKYVLDAGCGEGVLSCLMALRGYTVVGIDISEPNVAAAKKLAHAFGVEERVTFVVGDAEHLPFPDSSFDAVVSCHVLEHLPDFDQGVREIHRVTRGRAVVAIPTIINPCSWVQVGHGSFWEKNYRSLRALLVGLFAAVKALRTEGVDEGYMGRVELTHIFRFPWTALRHFTKNHFTVIHVEASSLAVPFFSSLVPLVTWWDQARAWPLFRWCGYGTTFLLQKNNYHTPLHNEVI